MTEEQIKSAAEWMLGFLASRHGACQGRKLELSLLRAECWEHFPEDAAAVERAVRWIVHSEPRALWPSIESNVVCLVSEGERR